MSNTEANGHYAACEDHTHPYPTRGGADLAGITSREESSESLVQVGGPSSAPHGSSASSSSAAAHLPHPHHHQQHLHHHPHHPHSHYPMQTYHDEGHYLYPASAEDALAHSHEGAEASSFFSGPVGVSSADGWANSPYDGNHYHDMPSGKPFK